MIPITDYSPFVKGKGPYLASAFEYRSQADNCMRYLTGLMTITERKNVSSINRPFLDYRNQASLNNFVTDSTWNDDALHQSAIRMVKDEVDRRNIKGGTLVIDDTLIEKSGKHMWGVGNFWDHGQKKYMLAQNLVSTNYFTGKFHLPLDFDVYRKEDDCKEGEFRTKVEIAKDLVSRAAGYGLPISCVVFDSWYNSRELIEHMRKLGIRAYVTEEENARLVISDDSRTKMTLAEFEKGVPRDKFMPVKIYTSMKGEERIYYAYCTSVRMVHLNGTKVRLVISYDNRELAGKPSFYVSNMRIWEAKKVLQTYALRWSIEGFHRDAKESLGLDDCQMRKMSGVKRHIAMVFLADTIMQISSGFSNIVKGLKVNLRTIGSKCRLANTEALRSLVLHVAEMAKEGLNADTIFQTIIEPLVRSKSWLG